MPKFSTTEARQELGVTPSTAVQFRGDTRTGEGLVGAAVGQAIVAGVEEFQRRSARKEAIEQNRQKMLDTRSSITADSFITTAINENVAFRSTNADTATWPKDLQERLSGVESQIGTLEMSDDNRLLVDAKFKAKSKEALSRSLIAETDRDKTDTRDAIIANVVEQVTNGTPQDQKDAVRNFSEIASTLMDENEARITLKTAIMAGQKAKGEKAISGVHAAAEAGNFEVARELAKNPLIPEPQQTTLRSMINSAETANFKLLQDATGRQMLADLLDGKLKDPQDIIDAVRLGLLSSVDGRYLHNALMNPEPVVLNLRSLATVKQAIEGIGTNTITVPEALSVLYANLDSIDSVTGKSLLNEIYSEQDKNKSEMKRESRSLMEELVRDRDKFTGMFTDDERQILAAAEAYLMLDAEIEKAVKTGKPLERRDIMIKAIQIGRQMKTKIKQEEKEKAPPDFQPTIEGQVAPRATGTKGALPKPDFVLDAEGEPEKVFDSKGIEIGIKRKAGGVFKIGYHVIIGGKKYEYTGNGNWVEAK